MTDVKSWIFSKGIWGSLIAILGVVLPLLGFRFGLAESTLLGQYIDSIIAAAGGLLALYGRITATKMIGTGGGV